MKILKNNLVLNSMLLVKTAIGDERRGLEWPGSVEDKGTTWTEF